MPIPPHKCVIARGYCEPDDGVHVIPTLGVPGVSERILKPWMPSDMILLRVERCDDVKLEHIPESDVYGEPVICELVHTTGYLVWVQEVRSGVTVDIAYRAVV